jgi:GT2 family glycosyltransferase
MIHAQPFFSIIIPTYARPIQLAACIKALARIAFSREDFEVIVVDDGSGLQLKGVLFSYERQLNLKLVSQSHAGPAAARNTGAKQAEGRFLVFTDDDCEPAPDWLHKLSRRFNAIPDCGIGGRIINRLPENLFSTASQMLLDYLYSYYNADKKQARFFASNNLALPAKLFHTIGGFDTTFIRAAAEDRELCSRWVNQGYQLIYADEVIVYHKHTLNFRSFCKQHFTYGYGAADFRSVRQFRGQKSVRVEPMSFYSNLLYYPWMKTGRLRAMAISILLAISQIANVAGFVRGLMESKCLRVAK